jgi:hypothetical protein
MRLLRLYLNRLLLIIFSFSLFLNFMPKKVLATTSFVHEVNADYQIKEDRSGEVTYSFKTTNKVGNDYLQSFSFNLPFVPKNISVAGSPTPLQVQELKQVNGSNVTRLVIGILSPKYGENNSFEWSFKFKVENIVLFQGVQNAIIVPTFNDDISISNYNISVAIPSNFGELAYFYGNAENLSDQSTIRLHFKSETNDASNFLILLGSVGEYFYEVTSNRDALQVHLPRVNAYQDIIYTSFPKRDFDEVSADSLLFDMASGENINALIRTKHGYDKNYFEIFSQITNPTVVEKLASQIDIKDKSKYQIAHDIYNLVSKSVSLSDYLTTTDTQIEFTDEDEKLNPAQLNSLYRQLLTRFGIENRGVYGYVFPVQPFIRETFVTEQHVWSEFWDGEKWIVVDPVWVITSKGGDYFDKNAYHHIKFGNYENFADLIPFFESSGVIKVTPLRDPQDIKKNIEVDMQAYDEAFLNKEFKLVLTNKSSEIVKINKITPSIETENIKIGNFTFDRDINLYPNSSVNITVPLEYGLLVARKQGDFRLNIEYVDANGEAYKEGYTHVISIRSNISSYFSLLIISVMTLFLLISLVSFLRLKIEADQD